MRPQKLGPFFLIRTRKGIEGWAYSRGLSNRPVYVEEYVCIVAFSNYDRIDDELKSDFRRFSDCFDKDDNYSFISKTRGFREVNIKNRYGDIIGVENISRLVDKNSSGVVILQKGKKPVFLPFPDSYEWDEEEYLWWETIYCSYGDCTEGC